MATIETIDQEIDDYKTLVQLEKDVKELIEKFKRYKLVNKSFCNALKEIGYFAYIVKDNDYKKISIKPIGSGNNFPSFYLRVYKESLTWDNILEEFKRYNYQKKLELSIEKKECFEKEKNFLENIYQQINHEKFKAFSLYDLQRRLGNLLNPIV